MSSRSSTTRSTSSRSSLGEHFEKHSGHSRQGNQQEKPKLLSQGERPARLVALDRHTSTDSQWSESMFSMASSLIYNRSCEFTPSDDFTEEENAILLKLSKELNQLSQEDVMSIVEELTVATTGNTPSKRKSLLSVAIAEEEEEDEEGEGDGEDEESGDEEDEESGDEEIILDSEDENSERDNGVQQQQQQQRLLDLFEQLKYEVEEEEEEEEKLDSGDLKSSRRRSLSMLEKFLEEKNLEENRVQHQTYYESRRPLPENRRQSAPFHREVWKSQPLRGQQPSQSRRHTSAEANATPSSLRWQQAAATTTSVPIYHHFSSSNLPPSMEDDPGWSHLVQTLRLTVAQRWHLEDHYGIRDLWSFLDVAKETRHFGENHHHRSTCEGAPPPLLRPGDRSRVRQAYDWLCAHEDELLNDNSNHDWFVSNFRETFQRDLRQQKRRETLRQQQMEVVVTEEEDEPDFCDWVEKKFGQSCKTLGLFQKKGSTKDKIP